MIALLAAALTLAAPVRAQDFAAEMPAVRDLVDRAGSHRAWTVSHKNGILQQIDDAVAHLTAETKPSVAMVVTPKGLGTGFIADPSGLLITNAHVVIESGLGAKVRVVFADGSAREGLVAAIGSVGTSAEPFAGRDLAVVKLPARAQGWPALALGDSSQLREGHMVAMMGYPLGLPFTVTEGVIGGLDGREGGLKGFPVKFVQSDAAINPGNSGGPLMTMDGTVAGVNTLSFSRTGGSDGLGFSIGADAVKAFLSEYKARGSFRDAPVKAGPRRAPAPFAASCPSPESLSRPWVEHDGPAPADALAAHRRAALDGAAPTLLPVGTVSWWIGAARRGRGGDAGDPACFVRGSAALYANGPEDAPAADFVAVVSSGGEDSLRPALIELRWFDARDGRKHRWFDAALAGRLGWPSGGPRPIPLPQAVNELL